MTKKLGWEHRVAFSVVGVVITVLCILSLVFYAAGIFYSVSRLLEVL